MMRLRTVEGPSAMEEAAKPLPFGPGVTDGLGEGTRLEIWGTTWNDGEDFIEFRVYGGDECLSTVRVVGF